MSRSVHTPAGWPTLMNLEMFTLHVGERAKTQRSGRRRNSGRAAAHGSVDDRRNGVHRRVAAAGHRALFSPPPSPGLAWPGLPGPPPPLQASPLFPIRFSIPRANASRADESGQGGIIAGAGGGGREGGRTAPAPGVQRRRARARARARAVRREAKGAQGGGLAAVSPAAQHGLAWHVRQGQCIGRSFVFTCLNSLYHTILCFASFCSASPLDGLHLSCVLPFSLLQYYRSLLPSSLPTPTSPSGSTTNTTTCPHRYLHTYKCPLS